MIFKEGFGIHKTLLRSWFYLQDAHLIFIPITQLTKPELREFITHLRTPSSKGQTEQKLEYFPLYSMIESYN